MIVACDPVQVAGIVFGNLLLAVEKNRPVAVSIPLAHAQVVRVVSVAGEGG